MSQAVQTHTLWPKRPATRPDFQMFVFVPSNIVCTDSEGFSVALKDVQGTLGLFHEKHRLGNAGLPAATDSTR